MSHIGILGLAGAGKDTVGAAIRRDHDVVLERFAAPLKDAARLVFGEDFDERDVKETPVGLPLHMRMRMYEAQERLFTELRFSNPQIAKAQSLCSSFFDQELQLSPRKYQQVLGTEVVRSIRPRAFIERVTHGEYECPVLVTDCRYENELGEKNYLVIRPGLWNAEKPGHESEHLAWELERHWRRHYDVVETTIAHFGAVFNILLNKSTQAALEKEASTHYGFSLET